MAWISFLKHQREDKRKRLYALRSGIVRLHMTLEGVQTDITDEQIKTLEADVAEIEEILTSEGEQFDA